MIGAGEEGVGVSVLTRRERVYGEERNAEGGGEGGGSIPVDLRWQERGERGGGEGKFER